MSRFYVGQPVICVRGGPNPASLKLNLDWPVTGSQYRIRAVYAPMRTRVGLRKWANLTFVLVHGITNKDVKYGNGVVAEAAFWDERFEPATNIDGIRSVLTSVDNFMGDDGPEVDRKVKHRQKEKA